MKKLLYLIPFLFFSAFASAETLQIEQFGGLNTDDSAATLPANQTPDAENVYTDIGPGLTGRSGFTELSTTTCEGGLWVFPHSNGTRYLVCHDTSVDILKASSDGGMNFTTTISTLASGVKTAVTTVGNKVYFTNTTDGLKSWDTSSVAVASDAIKANQLVTHKGCLWASGFTDEPRTIKKSAFVTSSTDPSWEIVTDPVATDPGVFIIGGALDEALTGLYASHQGKLMWFKSNSFGAVIGDDRLNFQPRVYSDKFGTAYPGSVQDCGGLLRWLGGNRTIWEWNGVDLTDITQLPTTKIKNLMATVGQGDANLRSYTWDTQVDFSLGESLQVSTSIAAGSVVLPTMTVTDTNSFDFAQGTSNNVSTSTVSDVVILDRTNENLENPSFETVFGSEWTTTGSAGRSSDFARTGTYSAFWSGPGACSSEGVSWTILAFDDTPLQTINGNYVDYAQGAWNQQTFNISAYIGRVIKFRYNGGAHTLTSEPFIVADPFGGGNAEYIHYVYKHLAPGPGTCSLYVDDIDGDRSTISSGTFLSTLFDTQFSSAAWMPSDYSATSNGHTVAVRTQSSPDGTTWGSSETWTSGSSPSSAWDRYIRYQVEFSTTGDGTALPYFSDATLSARASTGSWVSNSVSLGSPSSFSAFGIDETLNSGTITYAVYTDSDTNKTVTDGVPVAGTFLSSQTVTSGQVPSLSTSAYAFVSEQFSITSATQNPTNNSVSLFWSEGSTLDVPSLYVDLRYWMGVSINSTSNNRVLVFDRNRQWQRWNGMSVASIVLYNGKPVFSNSDGTFQGETGYTNDGTAIAAYYKTGDFSPSGPRFYSKLNDLYLTTDNSPLSLTTTWQANGVDTDYSMGSMAMDDQDGINQRRFPFSASSLQQARNINFKWSVTQTAFWRLLGAELDFTPDVVAP